MQRTGPNQLNIRRVNLNVFRFERNSKYKMSMLLHLLNFKFSLLPAKLNWKINPRQKISYGGKAA